MGRFRKTLVASTPVEMDDAAVPRLALDNAKPRIRAGLEAAVVALARADWELVHGFLMTRGWRLGAPNEWSLPGGAEFTTGHAMEREVRASLEPFAWLAGNIREHADKLETRERPALHRAESVVPKHPFADTDDDDL